MHSFLEAGATERLLSGLIFGELLVCFYGIRRGLSVD